MLHEAGYRMRKESKELVVVDPENEVEFFYLRPKDIAIYVSSGKLDIGITGRDLLLDSGASAEEILPLNFGRSTFRYATTPGTAKGPEDFDGMTIATSYEGIVAKHLADQGIDASVVHLDGAVETAIQLGVARSSPTSSRPAPACATPAWRSSASRSSPPRPSSSAATAPTPTTRRSSSSCAASRVSWWPAAT